MKKYASQPKKKAKPPLEKSTHNTEFKEVAKVTKISKEIKDKAFYYYAKGLTVKEVSKLMDLSFRTVQNWQSEYSWTEKLNPISLKEKCFELKTKGLTLKEISEMIKISISTVQRYVNEVKAAENLKNQNKPQNKPK